jgi:hypothetical protein
LRVGPSTFPRLQARRQEPSPSKGGTDPDYLVLVYSANNVSSLGMKGEPVAGSFRLIPELKELAPKTKGSSVSVVTQGYEKLETGEWVTRRYRAEHGQLKDETARIDGFRSLYDDSSPPEYQGRVRDTGEGVSMFSQEAVEDFMLDAMADYPKAKHVVLFLNAHGAPTPNFGGEAIIDNQWQRIRQEELSVKSFGHALQSVAEENGARLSLLDLNTCEMGKVENLLELGEHADFLLASPQNEFVPTGHEYTAAFQDIVGTVEYLIEDSSASPRQVGEKIIELTTDKTTFVERGVTENPIPTLDLYDTGRLGELGDSLGQAGFRMSAMLRDPEQRSVVIESFRDSFHFRESVFDLKGFLQRVGEPETKALAKNIDDTVIATFSGKFRGRDYSQAGPIAAFGPKLPDDDVPPVLVPDSGSDLAPVIDGLLGAEIPEKRLRMWVVKQSGRLHEIHSNLNVSYPAMLEILPNPKIEKALKKKPNPDKLLGLAQELQKHMSFSSKEKVQPVQDEVEATVGPLREALKDIDAAAWLEEFEAMGGSQKLAERAMHKRVSRARAAALEPVRDYQELDNLPAGWKSFMEELANAVVDEVWAKAFKTL